jgi:hypothetical protein
MNSPRRPGFAQTAADSEDPALRGLTCAVPFDAVWQATLRLAGGGLRGWTVAHADDCTCAVLAVARGLTGAVHDVAIDIVLDEDGQTRVDARVAARKAPDLGRSRRRLRRFFRALGRALERMPPSAPPALPHSGSADVRHAELPDAGHGRAQRQLAPRS